MRSCDLYTGANRIRIALERVEQVWDEASEKWNDRVSEKFREQHLDPLAPDVKLTLDAIARMQQVIDRAQRDLEE